MKGDLEDSGASRGHRPFAVDKMLPECLPHVVSFRKKGAFVLKALPVPKGFV